MWFTQRHAVMFGLVLECCRERAELFDGGHQSWGTNRFTPSAPEVSRLAARIESASSSADSMPAARKPRPPPLDTAATNAGVDGPPAMGAPSTRTLKSANANRSNTTNLPHTYLPYLTQGMAVADDNAFALHDRSSR